MAKVTLYRAQLARKSAIAKLANELLEKSWPRSQMMLIVALTGAVGGLASFILLKVGVLSMALRYPLAVAIAYVFFLFLIWLWLRTNAQDYSGFPDVAGGTPSSGGSGTGRADIPGEHVSPAFESGGGGDFAGGGAQASFDAPIDLVSDTGGATGSWGEGLGSVAEAEDLAIPVVAIVLAVGLALASFHVVYIAPTLFAEILVDGVLSYAFYRHIGAESRDSWISISIRKTVLSFA
ncbi:MAG: hypothetical protein ACKOWD_09145, partial [Rhodoferax sp.]